MLHIYQHKHKHSQHRIFKVIIVGRKNIIQSVTLNLNKWMNHAGSVRGPIHEYVHKNVHIYEYKMSACPKSPAE